MAAGKGKRLRPLTYLHPKPAIPLAGISLLDYYLLLLSRLEFKEIVILIGHLGDEIVDRIRSNESLSIKADFVNQVEQLGTGHAVSLLKEKIREEDFLLIYSDVFMSVSDLKKLLKAAKSSEFDHVVAVARVEEPWKFGVVLEEDEMLKGIVEKPPKGKEPSNKVIAGAFYFDNSIFSYIEGLSKSPRGEYELTDAIQEAAKCGERVKVLVLQGGWTDAGTFPNLLEASRLLFHELSKEKLYLDLKWSYQNDKFGPGIEEPYQDVEIQGPVFIGENVKVGRGSKIGPYVVLYENVNVGENVKISNSILLGGTSVGKGSSIDRSIVGDGSSIGREVKLRRTPDRGFGMVLGRGVRIDDFREIDPGTVLSWH